MDVFDPVLAAGLMPLIVALVSAWVFMRYLPRAAGLAAFAGYMTTVLLIAAGGPQSLAPINRIVFAGGMAAVASLTLDGAATRLSKLLPFIWPLAVATIIWVLWPAFETMFLMNALLFGYVFAIYTAWLSWALPALRNRPLHAHGAVVALAFGTGGATVFGGLAISGMLAFGMGAAACAGLGINLLARRPLQAGYALALPGSMTLTAVAAVAAVYGQLPAVCLAALALIPLPALLVPASRTRSWWMIWYLGAPLALAFAAVQFAARPEWVEPYVPDPLREIRNVTAVEQGLVISHHDVYSTMHAHHTDSG